jgi:ribonucleoside-diphosphate reductase alpha chain
MKLTENAKILLNDRYLNKNESGQVIETPEDLFRRVAINIASADKLYGAKAKEIKATENEFYDIMEELKFLPNSPTLFNAGKKYQQLSACFVLPIEDSMSGIFGSIYDMAMIQKSGGGTGFSFSRLRPEGDIVSSSMGKSSGPISFLKAFDGATDTIKQGGMRRGANMGVLRIDHPDIEKFIKCKDKEGSIANFNLSIAITNEFMEKAAKNEDYALVNPRDGTIVRFVNARHMLDTISLQAWKNGEPGVIFIDEINNDNPLVGLGLIEATNPCGEQPLFPYESCNLGSVNLAKFVKDKDIDYDELARVIHIAVHFLDNVIDMNKYPMEKIEEKTKANRKIGLGVMGWADLLIMLDIPYDSGKAISLAHQIMEFINTEALEASCNLAEDRGSFPNLESSIYSDWDEPPRNATRTTIAPTGSLSRIAGCSSGIEPYFALAHKSFIIDKELLDVCPLLEGKIKECKVNLTVDEVVKAGGSLQKLNVPEEFKRVFKTSGDIPADAHIRMQAAFQEGCDNAVSKTINMPNSASVEDVFNSYVNAWKAGCKGLTVYRDGSRVFQVLSTEKKKERPRELEGRTVKINTGCGSMYITINSYEGNIFEVFAHIGKSGGCAIAANDALCMVISASLRNGVPLDEIITKIRGIRCPKPGMDKGPILSCPDAIGQALQSFSEMKMKENTTGACPLCGGTIVFEEGCMKCAGCGESRCG